MVNRPVKGRRSGYGVPVVTAAGAAEREGEVIHWQRDHIRLPGWGDIAMVQPWALEVPSMTTAGLAYRPAGLRRLARAAPGAALSGASPGRRRGRRGSRVQQGDLPVPAPAPGRLSPLCWAAQCLQLPLVVSSSVSCWAPAAQSGPMSSAPYEVFARRRDLAYAVSVGRAASVLLWRPGPRGRSTRRRTWAPVRCPEPDVVVVPGRVRPGGAKSWRRCATGIARHS